MGYENDVLGANILDTFRELIVDRPKRVGTCLCRLKYVTGVIKKDEICDKMNERKKKIRGIM